MNTILKSILLALPCMLFIWLLALDIRPKGEQVIHYDIGDHSAFVTPLVPTDRVDGGELLGDPVYLTLQTPHADFTSLQVDIAFAPGDAQVLEFGPSNNVAARSFDLRPVYHKAIEGLDWFSLKQGDALLYARDVLPFDGLDIAFSTVRTYFAQWTEPVSVRPAHATFTTGSGELRGYHKLFVAIPEGLGTATVRVRDLGQVAGQDDVIVRLLDSAGKVIAEETDPVNGAIELDAGFVRAGIYALEIAGTADLVIEAIELPYRYVVVEDRLSVYEAAGRQSWYTNARAFKVRAVTAQGIQTITVGQDKLALTEVGEWVEWTARDGGQHRVDFSEGGIEIVGEGYYAKDQRGFFEPSPLTFTSLEDATRDGVDYVLTTYQKATATPTGYTRTLYFDPNLYKDPEGVITFAFSVPGAESLKDAPEIQSITFTFRRKPLTAPELLESLKKRLPFL